MSRARSTAMFAACASGSLFAMMLAQAASPPPIPETLKVPAGEHLILTTHATGAQIYTCQAGTDASPSWTLKAPDAQLRDAKGRLVIHHFAGPTWKHQDGSSVTGKAVAHADAPDGKSIPWLLLTATGHDGTGLLSKVSSVQRLNTTGGKPPTTGCDASKVGSETRSAYTADYYFYVPSP